jgi:hypothetical protein
MYAGCRLALLQTSCRGRRVQNVERGATMTVRILPAKFRQKATSLFGSRRYRSDGRHNNHPGIAIAVSMGPGLFEG